MGETGEEMPMTIEILKSMAKENQVLLVYQALYQKTHIEKEMLWVILSRMEEKGFIERIEKGKFTSSSRSGARKENIRSTNSSLLRTF